MLMDVTFQKLLYFFRHVADARFSDSIIPLDDFDSRVLRGVLRNPGCDRLIVGASGNQRPERLGVDAGEFEKETVKRAIKMILTKSASNGSAALIEHASGEDVASQRFARAARKFMGEVFCFQCLGLGVHVS